PYLLWALLAPAIWLGWELTHRRRRSGAGIHPKILRAEAGTSTVDLLPTAAGTSAKSRPRVWLALGLAFGIVAIARPQWGRLEEPVFDQAREILLAIDLSRSMLTPDVKPSRLDRGKLLISSLLEKLEGERVGLVVFSGTAFLQSPLSADYEILREFLPNLGPDFLPEGGTNYRALIDTSLSAFGSSSAADRFLIVLSDGEATDEDWKSHIPELKKKGIRVIGLGVGTSSGAMIPDGSGGFIKDDRGAVVLSKLESGTLQELATATGGAYRDASAWVDLAALLKQTVEAGQKGQFVEKNTVRLVERFQWPLALGLWCLLASLCYEFPVQPRPRDVKLASSPGGSKTGGVVSGTAALLLAAVLFGHNGITSVRAAAVQVPLPSTPALSPATPTPPPAAPPPASALLSKIVGRLAVAENRSGRDWADLARETVSWGRHLQEGQQAVPEGPVRDALAAVELGSKADAKIADWPKLREELEPLLEKSEEKKDDQQKPPDNQKQPQDQKNQDQQKQDSKSSPQNQKSDDQKQSDSPQKQDPSQPPQKDENTPQKSPDSAFGDMKEKNEQPPPPPQGDTQKVGGAPEKRPLDPAAADPALAQSLQKLEQLRNEDSPAKLFQLMEGERKTPPNKKGKDW
ncbi:MAG: VWA domain-containing protein, partial [Opitutaceae bacterium]